MDYTAKFRVNEDFFWNTKTGTKKIKIGTIITLSQRNGNWCRLDNEMGWVHNTNAIWRKLNFIGAKLS